MLAVGSPAEAWDQRQHYHHPPPGYAYDRYLQQGYAPRRSLYFSNGATTYYERSEYVPVFQNYRYQQRPYRYSNRYSSPRGSRFQRGDNSTRFLQPNHGWRQ